MTINNIIVAALLQLDRGQEAQTIEIWQEKFMFFANEAVLDIAQHLGLKRQDVVTVENGKAPIPDNCMKILKLEREGKILPFLLSDAEGSVKVNAADGEVHITYHYAPKKLTNLSETPELPEYTHGLIVDYVVGRERATQDPSMQRGANVFFEIYNEGKRKLKRNMGEPDSYKIYNRW